MVNQIVVIQKADSYTGRYRDMYLCDNECNDDCYGGFEYSKWLDPDGVPCYVRDLVCHS